MGKGIIMCMVWQVCCVWYELTLNVVMLEHMVCSMFTREIPTVCISTNASFISNL